MNSRRVTTLMNTAIDYAIRAGDAVSMAVELIKADQQEPVAIQTDDDNTDAIKALFYRYQNSSEYIALRQLPEARQSDEDMRTLLDSIEITKTDRQLIEDADEDKAASYEMQGFIYGFQYAVKLLVSGNGRRTAKGGATQ